MPLEPSRPAPRPERGAHPAVVAAIAHVDTSGPRPVVSGTDIKVSQIASEVERMGMTPDEVVAAHPHLTLGDVHGALAYFYDRPEAIRAEWREADELIASLQAQFPPSGAGR